MEQSDNQCFTFEDSHLIEMRAFGSEVQHKLAVLSDYAKMLNKSGRYNECVRRYDEIQHYMNEGDASGIHSAAKLANRFFCTAAFGFLRIACCSLQRQSRYDYEIAGYYSMFKTLSSML